MPTIKILTVEENWDKLDTQVRQKTSVIVRKTTLKVERRIKMKMQEQKSGMTYPRGANAHRASAPGQAPAIDYGALISSIQSDFPTLLSGRVFTNSEYAAPLEFGTVRMAPRPFMAISVEEEESDFRSEINGILGR